MWIFGRVSTEKNQVPLITSTWARPVLSWQTGQELPLGLRPVLTGALIFPSAHAMSFSSVHMQDWLFRRNTLCWFGSRLFFGRHTWPFDWSSRAKSQHAHAWPATWRKRANIANPFKCISAPISCEIAVTIVILLLAKGTSIKTISMFLTLGHQGGSRDFGFRDWKGGRLLE